MPCLKCHIAMRYDPERDEWYCKNCEFREWFDTDHLEALEDTHEVDADAVRTVVIAING